MAAVSKIYSAGAFTEEDLKTVRVLACHLNNLWPASLQAAIETWLTAPAPANDEHGHWRQLYCFWVSLYKKKAQMEHPYDVLNDFNTAVAEHEHGYETNEARLKKLYADFLSAQDDAERNRALLNLSAFFYRANREGSEELIAAYRTTMHKLFPWASVNRDALLDPAVIAIYLVHTEGIDELDPEEAASLVLCQHWGWLSAWPFLQMSDSALKKIDAAYHGLSVEARAHYYAPEVESMLAAVITMRFGA